MNPSRTSWSLGTRSGMKVPNDHFRSTIDGRTALGPRRHGESTTAPEPAIESIVDIPTGRDPLYLFDITSFSPGKWAGIELNEPVSGNDGAVRGAGTSPTQAKPRSFPNHQCAALPQITGNTAHSASLQPETCLDDNQAGSRAQENAKHSSHFIYKVHRTSPPPASPYEPTSMNMSLSQGPSRPGSISCRSLNPPVNNKS